MDKVSVFESSDFGEIRVMVINDQPWFVGSDIASALGYSNASKAVSAHVDEEDIDRILLTDLERFTQNGKSRINNSKVMIINESSIGNKHTRIPSYNHDLCYVLHARMFNN